MELPSSLRDAIFSALETYLDAVDVADTEAVVRHIIEQLEMTADEHDMEDLPGALADHASLDSSLSDCLEEAFTSGEDFEFTGEMIVSTFEEMCEIEWVDDKTFMENL